MPKTRKQQFKNLMKKYRRTIKQRGGMKDQDGNIKMFNGIIEAIKLLIANKVAMLVNWQVTSRLNERLLKGLPTVQKDYLVNKINTISNQMSTDMAKKGLDTGENMARAVPAFGNLISLVSAGDKAMAGIKNARQALLDIKAEIEQVKTTLIAAGFNPAKDFPFLDSIPDIPQIPLLDQVEGAFDYINANVEQTGGLIEQKDEPHLVPYKKVISRTNDSIKAFNN